MTFFVQGVKENRACGITCDNVRFLLSFIFKHDYWYMFGIYNNICTYKLSVFDLMNDENSLS